MHHLDPHMKLALDTSSAMPRGNRADDRPANGPFRFVSCMELREVLGKRAMDEHRLLELIEEVPADSLYYHTHSYYLRHSYSQGPFPNDFATWVALHAQDRVLAERLGQLSQRSHLLAIDLGDHVADLHVDGRILPVLVGDDRVGPRYAVADANHGLGQIVRFLDVETITRAANVEALNSCSA